MIKQMLGQMFGAPPVGGQLPPPVMPTNPQMGQRPQRLPMAPGMAGKMMHTMVGRQPGMGAPMPQSRQSAQLNPSVGQLLSNFGSSPKTPPGMGGY